MFSAGSWCGPKGWGEESTDDECPHSGGGVCGHGGPCSTKGKGCVISCLPVCQ